MTIVSEIITDAHRLGNILAIGTTPTDEEMAEGLRYLNRLVKSVFGNEAGDALESFPIGRNGISHPSGYPWWNDVPDNDWFVPKNTRVVLNLESSISLYLHPDPDDGSRFAAKDVSGTLATYPLSVFGNGRLIEDQFSITLDTNGFDGEWFYRADLSNWIKYAPLALDDTFPFPEEFDDFFITLLAIRINPAYGVSLDDQGKLIFTRAKTQFRARYNQDIQMRSELGLIRMPRTAADRDIFGTSYRYYNPNSMFDKGWPW